MFYAPAGSDFFVAFIGVTRFKECVATRVKRGGAISRRSSPTVVRQHITATMIRKTTIPTAQLCQPIQQTSRLLSNDREMTIERTAAVNDISYHLSVPLKTFWQIFFSNRSYSLLSRASTIRLSGRRAAGRVVGDCVNGNGCSDSRIVSWWHAGVWHNRSSSYSLDCAHVRRCPAARWLLVSTRR